MKDKAKTRVYLISMLDKGLGVLFDNGYYFQTSFLLDWYKKDNLDRVLKALEDSNYKFTLKIRGEGV